jgi:polysaccharide export outer membrane protein
LAAKASDPMMRADDILFVPDSTAKKAFRRGLEAALQTATYLAIYAHP